jgi:cysteine desulfurase
MTQDFGNPSSRHALGLRAEEQVRGARRRIAEQIGAAAEGVFFTSGGTEANAWALISAAGQLRKGGHFLLSAIEHPSVLHTANQLAAKWGGDLIVEQLPVTAGGWVDPQELKGRMRTETALVAVMHVNNETGIRQPIEQLARIVKGENPRCLFLVDAVQSFGTLPFTMEQLQADYLTLSGHKIHGPKGIGCLVIRPGIRLTPLWGGGEQEGGKRPGTENVPGIVGLSRAVELLRGDSHQLERYGRLLEEAVLRNHRGAYLLGDPTQRAPHILSLALPRLPSEVLINLLQSKGLCVSSGSACHSRRSLRSHVLEAMHIPKDHGVIRLSLSSLTTGEEVEEAAKILEQALKQLK